MEFKIHYTDLQAITMAIKTNTEPQIKVNNFIRKIGLPHLTVQYKTIHLQECKHTC